jgi:hypothetical protein
VGKASKARRAEELYQDGELERVLALTKNDPKADARLWRAKALLRQGDLAASEEALGTLAGGPALAVRAWVALRRGEWERARELLERAGRELDGEARLEASFWNAWCAAMLGRHAEARDRWRELASGSESPAARRAAACLLEDGPRSFQAASTLLWPRTKELPEQSEGPYGERYDRARSTTALLELQDDDGSRRACTRRR